MGGWGCTKITKNFYFQYLQRFSCCGLGVKLSVYFRYGNSGETYIVNKNEHMNLSTNVYKGISGVSREHWNEWVLCLDYNTLSS